MPYRTLTHRILQAHRTSAQSRGALVLLSRVSDQVSEELQTDKASERGPSIAIAQWTHTFSLYSG